MKAEINKKEILLCTFVVIGLFFLIEIFIVPKINFNTDFISKGMEKIRSSQNISPYRLYVNTWRIVKNSYVNADMNNQDWYRWRYKYKGEIKTFEDAVVAINTMLLSLYDAHVMFLTPELLKKQKNILESSDTPTGKTIEYTITDDNIGIIKINSIMGQETIDIFKEIILNTNDTKALIIDLRNNDGGIVANAVVMANYMMDKDEIIKLKSRTKEQQIFSDGENIFKSKPVLILINQKTASAAEMLAGMLKNKLNATLVGENTLGKNSVQQIIPLYNNCGLVLSTYKYILPDGTDIGKQGLIPDIYDNKNQINTAFNILRKG